MQVHAAVRQGNWAATTNAPFGDGYLDEVEALLRVAGAARAPDDDNMNWRELDALLLKRAVTVDTGGCTTVGDLKARCLDAALHTGLAAPLNTPWRPRGGGRRGPRPGPHHRRAGAGYRHRPRSANSSPPATILPSPRWPS